MKKTAGIIIAAFIVTTSIQAAIVVNYEFNEAAGSISNAVNTGSATVVPWLDAAQATLNGSGQMVVSGGNMGRQNPSISSGAINGGTAYFRIDFNNWDMAQGTTFGLRTKGVTLANSYLRVALNTANVALPADSGLGAFTWMAPSSNPNTVGNSFIIGLDMDADTFAVWHDPGLDGTYSQLISTNLLFGGVASDANQVNAITLDPGNTGASGSLEIERLVVGTDFNEIATIPEPATLGLVAGFGGAILIIRRKFHI